MTNNPDIYIPTSRVNTFGDGDLIHTSDIAAVVGFHLRAEAATTIGEIVNGYVDTSTEVTIKLIGVQTLLDVADRIDPEHKRESVLLLDKTRPLTIGN